MSMSNIGTNFEVFVSKETFKFHAAHFVAYPGFRERLHGHNYRVGVRVLGSRNISDDGYLVDFGDIKDVVKRVCKELNEHFLCPTLSDVMQIVVSDDGDSNKMKASVTLTCEDGSVFVFPKHDCAMLPIVHATTEELSILLWSRILEGLDSRYLRKRGVHTMEITVTEAPGQESVFRLPLPEMDDNGDVAFTTLDVKSFITQGKILPAPCKSGPGNDDEQKNVAPTTQKVDETKSVASDGCDGGCQCCTSSLSQQLQRLVDAMNANKLKTDGAAAITVDDLKAAIDGNAE